jgi:uncharacterized protein (TIGR00255 family)
MTLQSMTGFSRSEGTSGRYRWAWELRSVNGKGLDMRLRLPQGHEMLEASIKEVLGRYISRGNLQINLSVNASESQLEALINQDALAAILSLKEQLSGVVSDAPMPFESLLGIKGLIEFKEREEDDAARAALVESFVSGFEVAAKQLQAMRQTEGASLNAILSDQVDRIGLLTSQIENDASRQPEVIRERLAAQVALLCDSAVTLDKDRLHAEAALIATKADLREELDRLHGHVKAARDLLSAGGPVGRKLDFLAQEFNRESNTICSKSNASAVTAAGIELKVVIDQFREQVQNLE